MKRGSNYFLLKCDDLWLPLVQPMHLLFHPTIAMLPALVVCFLGHRFFFELEDPEPGKSMIARQSAKDETSNAILIWA